MSVLDYTGAELNLMIKAMRDKEGNFHVKDDGTLQIVNVSDGKFHSEWLVTSNGKPKKKIQATGEA